MLSLQDPKNRFSAVLVIAADEYYRLLDAARGRRESFAEHLLAFPGEGPDAGMGRAMARPRSVSVIVDTDVLSATRRLDRVPKVAAWLAGQAETALFLNVITLGEIERGIWLAARRDAGFARDLTVWLDRTVTLFSDRILPFAAKDARV